MVEGSHLNTTGAPVVYTTIHVIDIPNNWPRNVNQSQPVRSVPGNCWDITHQQVGLICQNGPNEASAQIANVFNIQMVTYLWKISMFS